MSYTNRLFFLPALAFLMLYGCSETPSEPAAKKEPEKPLEPITGRQAFQYTFAAARAWASDSEPMRVRSMNLAEVKSEKGKAAAWEILFVSQSRGRAKSYTWSAVESSGNLHKGVFAGQEQSWVGSGQEQPFLPAAIKIDTPEALETALKEGETYLKKPGNKPPVTFLLELTRRFPDPTWRVLWGESVGSAEYYVFVDASTGKALGKSF